MQSLGHDTKAQFIEEGKTDKLNFTKIKNFYSVEDTIKKRQTTDWEKMFANHNQGLVSEHIENI